MKKTTGYSNIFYSLGYRDAIASFIATLRTNEDVGKTLKEYINLYEEKFGKDNPHIIWLKNNLDQPLFFVNSVTQKE